MAESPQDIAALRNRVETLESENRELEAEREQLDRECAQLEVELEAAEHEIAELESEVQQPPGVDPDESIATGSDDERVYLASKTRRHFHRPGCEWAKYIPGYKLLEFASHREAVAAGYRPCKTCRA
jgi:DNA repair exonuclease SbcCD ATPase subunit